MSGAASELEQLRAALARLIDQLELQLEELVANAAEDKVWAEQAVERTKSFANWYNGEHLHSAIRFVTPDARHTGRDRATLASRTILYANARAQHPERWSGHTRNWEPAGPVWLNPDRETSVPEIRDAA